MADLVFSRFEIEIDAGDNAIFHGGEVITGNLRISLKRPITIQAVKLQFKGRAAFIGDSNKKAEVEKVYFDQDFTLLERPPGRPDPGHFPWIADFLYSLPFECPLPKGCPTSYEGPHAFIRYFVRATLVEEINGGTTEYVVKKALTLIAPPEEKLVAGNESVAKDTAAFGGCCCKSKVAAELRLPKTMYVPGETVYASLTVDNRHSRKMIENMEVRLVDRVRRVGTGNSGVSPYRTLVFRTLDSADNIRSKQTLHKDHIKLLDIPPVPPSTPGDAASDAEDLPELAPNGKGPGLYESPSTTTLRFRKQPFLRLEYAVQVTLGTHLLLEAPIRIGAVPTEGEGVVLESFVAGTQPVTDTDEAGKLAFGGPFAYTPRYPVAREEALEVIAPKAEVAKRETSNGDSSRLNGEAFVKTVTETTIERGLRDDGEVIQTTTITTTTTTTEENPVTHEPEVLVEVVEETMQEVVENEKELDSGSFVDHQADEHLEPETPLPTPTEAFEEEVHCIVKRDGVERILEEDAAAGRENGYEVNGDSGESGEVEDVEEKVQEEGNKKIVVKTKTIKDGDTTTKITETITTIEDEEGTKVTRETTTETFTERQEVEE